MKNAARRCNSEHADGESWSRHSDGDVRLESEPRRQQSFQTSCTKGPFTLRYVSLRCFSGSENSSCDFTSAAKRSAAYVWTVTAAWTARIRQWSETISRVPDLADIWRSQLGSLSRASYYTCTLYLICSCQCLVTWSVAPVNHFSASSPLSDPVSTRSRYVLPGE